MLCPLKGVKDFKMKTHIFLTILGLGYLLGFVDAQCDLSKQLKAEPFPDISKSAAESYIMGVEYTIGGAQQTDYYVEYYDILYKRGRIESHIVGQNQVYLYRSETLEAWTIDNKNCKLNNITEVPEFFKDDQTDWLHYTESGDLTTVGPSAMFKIALDTWNKGEKDKMAYMGEIRVVKGHWGVYWRRCLPSGGYADYIFAEKSEESPFDTDVLPKFTPLRVVFKGLSGAKELSEQVYNIISFHPFIPKDVQPFQLPKGMNCERGSLVDGPTQPDFSDKSIVLPAEVMYRKLDKDNEIISSYYSTLMLAIDSETQHVAYYYSAWQTATPDQDAKEPSVEAPEYVIYDIKHMYAYKINYETGKCQISRDKSFIPTYKLPENGGNLSLTDPYVFFPNSELNFLSEGTERGLAVNIFEAEIEKFVLDGNTIIPRVVTSHSYLKPNEEMISTIAVENAPLQKELHFFRKSDEEEILSLNIFGFTTVIPIGSKLFDLTRCFKNEDDYLFLTIGFEIEEKYLNVIETALSEIEDNVVEKIIRISELNIVRMPAVMTDLKDNYVFVTMLILEKPPLQLDFTEPEQGKTISMADGGGASDFKICANNCLEKRNNCWGFSICGSTCYYGSTDNSKVQNRKGCTLYRRFSNETYVPSKESQAKEIVKLVEVQEFMIVAMLEGEMVTLTAATADITSSDDDGYLFDKLQRSKAPVKPRT